MVCNLFEFAPHCYLSRHAGEHKS